MGNILQIQFGKNICLGMHGYEYLFFFRWNYSNILKIAGIRKVKRICNKLWCFRFIHPGFPVETRIIAV